MGVDDLDPPKPEGKWCSQCHKSKGCLVYDTRPQSCRTFKCLWLEDALDAELKPSKCKAVLSVNSLGEMLQVNVDPGYPHAAEKGLLAEVLAECNRPYLLVVGKRRKLVNADLLDDETLGLLEEILLTKEEQK